MSRVPPILGAHLDVSAEQLESQVACMLMEPRDVLTLWARLFVRLAAGSQIGNVRIVEEKNNG